MLKWAASLLSGGGASDQLLSSDEVATLTALVADLADDYRLPDLSPEFSKALQASGELPEQSWGAQPTAGEIAIFVYQVARYVSPMARDAPERRLSSEDAIAKAAQDKFIRGEEMRSAAIEKRGLIRRVVRTLLLTRGPVQP